MQNTSNNAVIHQYVYGYDFGSNRTSEQIDLQVTQATYNAANVIQRHQTGGPLRVSGTLNEAATVSVNGNAAQVSGTNFTGSANVTPGSNQITVTATDASGLTNTNRYQVTVASGSPVQVLISDANGSLSNKLSYLGGINLWYGWDAENRLVGVGPNYQPYNQHGFLYNGAGQRVAETVNGQAIRYWIWDGDTLCQERDQDNNVTKRYHAQGVVTGYTLPATAANKLYYTRDHLGSIREMIDGTGAIRTRYDYDSWGRQTQISGNTTADFGYAGYYYYSYDGAVLLLTYYRAYDPDLGRWLSKDPIEEEGGVNLFEYAANRVATDLDPLGLAGVSFFNNHMDGQTATNNDRIPTKPGYFPVNGHGSPKNMSDDRAGYTLPAQGPKFDANALANYLRQPGSGWHPGQPVQLNACRTGMGPDSFAQQLANNLGVPVLAPNNYVVVHPDGSTEVGNLTGYDTTDNTGGWVTFPAQKR